MNVSWSDVFVYCLVVVFGLSSWLSVNSVFVELPLLVEKLPERWGLPAALVVIVQLACIGPLAVGLLEKWRCRCYNAIGLIYGLLVLGCVTTVVLAFLWDWTVKIGGEDRSGVLFLLFFLLSLVDCTSNVLFLPYMSRFRPNLLTVYFVGMGFSALVPSCLALLQGGGQIRCRLANSSDDNSTFVEEFLPPRFTVTVFNLLIFVFMCAALAAFACLNSLKIAKDQLATAQLPLKELNRDDIPVEQNTLLDDKVKVESASESSLTTLGYATLLFATAWVCALMNGVLPSLQSFACKPYGQLAYHLTATLSNLANPVACFVPFFVQLNSIPVVSLLTTMVTGLAAFILFQAISSPSPVLVGSDVGIAITVLVWIFAIGLLAYIRTVTAGILRGSQRPKALFWCGAATQLGSFCGAVLFFLLVNYTGWFTSASSC